jgi:Ni/Co efflux regulator RcnB
MKRILIAATALTLLASPMSGAFAQPRHDDHGPGNAMMMRHDDHRDNHPNWRKGGRIERNDWNRGRRVSDWQHRHLQRPPRGYEWRQVDNNYVLAAVAGGLIASVIAASAN